MAIEIDAGMTIVSLTRLPARRKKLPCCGSAAAMRPITGTVNPNPKAMIGAHDMQEEHQLEHGTSVSAAIPCGARRMAA